MRFNISKLSATLLALSLLTLHAKADDKTYLVVESASPQNYELTAVKDITFSDEGISVNLTNGQSKSFAYSSFDELRFSLSTTPTAIKGITEDAVPEGGEVFDLQGRKVATFKGNGETFSSLSLPKGIYIVRSGNKSFKVINR